jgi:Ca-activated chloride channel family protein
MLKLAHNEHLWALMLLAFLSLLFLLNLLSRNKHINLFGSDTLVNKLMPKASSRLKNLKFTLIFIAFASLVIAWANPLLGTKYESVKREGIDVIFAIDVSKSMEAQDIIPSRMLKAKQLVSNAINQMSNDRIGLIVFAGNAYLQMPVTVDYSGAKMYLKTINTSMAPKQGTAISEAVNLAVNSFDEEAEAFKTIIIISDGESHDGDAETAIKQAKEQGIIVHTIGVGSSQGAKIPIDNLGNFKKDNNGEIVTTQLNATMLKELANLGGGNYFNASSSNLNEQLILALNGQEARMIDEKVFTSFKNHFPAFLGIALLLLLIEFLIPERKIQLLFKS